MRKNISKTLALTLLTSQVQGVSFAQDKIEDNFENTIIEEISLRNDYKSKAKLELDINFDMPIKYTTKEKTGINVLLKDSNENIVLSVDLGNDNLSGKNDENVSYTLVALDSKRENQADTDVSFYHLTFSNLDLGTYSMEISAQGYKNTTIDNIEIKDISKRVVLGTSDKFLETEEGNIEYKGAFLVGDLDNNSKVTKDEYEEIKSAIKNSKSDKKYDLNRDGKVDITDLSYVHNNLEKVSQSAVIEDTDPIIDINKVEINTENLTVSGQVKDILTDDNTVTFSKSDDVSKDSPISIPINLGSSVKTEQIVIKSPQENKAESGNVVIKTSDGSEEIIEFSSKEKSTEENIVINLGKQVAVTMITINITGTRNNKNLVEIAKVDFLNNVYKEIPKPKMNIPVIDNFTSATSVGQEHLKVMWNHEQNVSGYKLKVEEYDESGENRLNTRYYKTAENYLKIEGVTAYSIYRISIQSLNGDWESGYKDEQEGYDENKIGNTNLENNANDKDGIPDNVDKNYSPQAWDSKTGVLSNNMSNYGRDSIIELQVIPETIPEGPEGIEITEGYKTLNVKWKSHRKARAYDLYYRKEGSSEWIKANTDYIKATNYTLENLEDKTTYEVYLTATNHLGTGGASNISIGTTTDINPPVTHNYKLIDNENVKSITSTSNLQTGNTMNMVDKDYTTYWQHNDWDLVTYKYSFAPEITFDKKYNLGSLKIIKRLDLSESTYQTKVQYFDETTNSWKEVEHTFNQTDNSKVININFKEKVYTNKIKVGISNYIPSNGMKNVSISEMKFYEYDSLEDDVANLFEDELLLKLKSDVTAEKIQELTDRVNTVDEVSKEYHPNKTQILSDLQRALDLLNDTKLDDRIKVLNPNITNSTNDIGQSNDWQSLGVAVKPGDKVIIYIGSNRVNKNTQFELGISQHNGETSTAFMKYNGNLSIGKNEIVIPSSNFTMDVEKGGNLYIRFKNNYSTSEKYSVRVSGANQIPHLDLNNIISDNSKETEAKEKIREYLKELKTYVGSIESKYPATEDKSKNIYKYDAQTSILNSTEIEGDRITLSLAADKVLEGIESGLSSEDEKVNRLYETLRAWEQLMQISYSQQGLLEQPIDFDGNGKIDDTAQSVLDGKSEIIYYTLNKAPKNRINIKYQRMFTGAFMYASTHHVGIGYNSIADMMKGVTYKYDSNGNLTNANAANLFGWAISHEIGHVHDIAGLTYVETTNNILALITQTFNDINNSRVEQSQTQIYDRVTSGSLGTPTGTIGLGMFWQLHLAYDNTNTYDMLKVNTDTDITNDTFYAKLYRLTRIKGVAQEEEGYDSTAQTFIRRCSDAVELDLREFFKRWGIEASPKTNEYLDEKNYKKETRAIYYLNDDARRKRLEALKTSSDLSSLSMASDTKVVASFADGIANNSYISKNEVSFEFSTDKDSDKILGYELIRVESTTEGEKETPVGFVLKTSDTTKYTDIIDSVNNRVFKYKVKAYDYNLNVTEETEIGSVKIKHDGTIEKSKFTFMTNTRGENDVVDENTGHGSVENGSINNIKDGDINTVYNGYQVKNNLGYVEAGDLYVTTDLGSIKPVVGLKYTPPIINKSKKFSLKNLFTKSTTYEPITKYKVYVSEDNKNWTLAHSGTFKTDEASTIYFNEAGNDDNNQLWTYNAKYVKLVSVGADTISIGELDILGPPGDNIEIGENFETAKNGIGKLAQDYTLQQATSQTEEVVIPKDSIIITGEYTGDPAFNVPLILNENNENFATKSHVTLLATLPEESELGAVAKGTYIYWITPYEQNTIEGKQVKAELYRYNKLNSSNNPEGQRLVSDTFLVDIDLAKLPTITLNSTKNSQVKVIEVDEKLIESTLKNR